jgi:flagellar motor switch protein FliM
VDQAWYVRGVHRPSPFPWDRLQRLTVSQVALLDRVSAWLAGRSSWTCGGLEPALGAPLSIAAREVLAGPGPAWRAAGEASQLVLLEHAGSRAPAMLEVDAPVALELVWTCLNGSIDASIAAPRPLDRVEQGVLLYLAARALWSLWEGSPFRVAGPGTGADLRALGEETVSVHLELGAGAMRGHAWLHLSPALGAAAPPRGAAPPARRLAGLVPAAVHAVLGRARLDAAQLAGLGPGDTVILDEAWCDVGPDGALRGTPRLRLPLGRPRWAAELSAGGRELVVTGGLAPAVDEGGEIMDQAEERLPGTPAELLEEIPAELSVELGRVALTAGAALGLRPGQTLRLARRPGDPVDVRIGPTLVARGELVLVDGELGVLIRDVFPEHLPDTTQPVRD